MTYVQPETPYCGFMRRFVKGREQLYVPRTAAHCLISAPTESGKSRRLLAPASALWVVRSCRCRPRTTSCS